MLFRSGKIELALGKDKKSDNLITQNAIDDILRHEYLHFLGQESEGSVEKIVQACSEKAQTFKKFKESTGTELVLGASSIQTSDNEVTTQLTAGVNKAIAETKQAIPAPQDISPAKLAQVIESSGSSTAETVSRSQSSAVLASVDRLAGMMESTAIAGTGSALASGGSSGASKSISFDRNTASVKIGRAHV